MPSRIRCYDNGGETFDRYTVVYLDAIERNGTCTARGMSERPTAPNGFGQLTTAMDGPHLGKRVSFMSLPDDCRRVVWADLGEL